MRKNDLVDTYLTAFNEKIRSANVGHSPISMGVLLAELVTLEYELSL